MNIEKTNIRTWESDPIIREVFEGEDLNKRLSALALEIFIKEREIGSGNYSQVFEDPETGACCKKLKPGEKPLNNVHQESSFLSELRDLSDNVGIPMPLISMDAFARNADGKISKCSLLIMEKIKGPSLEDVLTGKRDLPKSFEIETFFKNLEEFIINSMHKKGIYHRDIADRNIMIDEETGKPFLIDFGNSVYYSYDGISDGDKDPYGHVINDTNNLPSDLDVERLMSVKISMQEYLTNKL
jgi:serine/threonine protein kinase